jgi:hypothetical protein
MLSRGLLAEAPLAVTALHVRLEAGTVEFEAQQPHAL